MPEIHAVRRGCAQEKIAEAGVDAALITSGPNVRYLTGLASSNAALLVRADGTAVLATDGRYAGTATRVCPELECVIDRATASALTARAPGRLAFEAHDVTVEAHEELAGGPDA